MSQKRIFLSTEINEADSFLQQALQLSNLNDSYIERQNHSETILSDNGNETIMNKIDLLENKIKQITDINQVPNRNRQIKIRSGYVLESCRYSRERIK